MKYLSSLLFLTLMFIATGVQAQEDFRKNPPEPGPAPEIHLADHENFTLDNGLNVILVENHKLPTLSVQLFVDVPIHSEGESVGLSSIAGQLLSSGTTRRSKAEIDEAIDFIGASLSSSSNGVFGSSLSKHRETLLEIMSEVLLQPAFPEEEFEKIKTQTESGLAANETDPNAMASNLAQVLRYGADHPYGEQVTRQTLDNITLDQAREYYRTYFRPNISYLVLVGDLDLADARNLAEKYFGNWERAEVPETGYALPQPPQHVDVSAVDNPSAVQTVITLTYPLDYKPGSPDAMSASIMNDILGNSSNGRLFANVREDKGYTYGISSSLSSDENVGYFSISSSVRNEVTDSAITEILKEMERLREEPVSADELRRAKSVRNGSFARAMESPQTIARFALYTILYDLPEDYYSTYLERLAEVSVEDVKASADDYILPNRVHIAVVGNMDEIMDKVLPFDSDGKIDMYDAYGRPVKEAEAAPADLTPDQVLEDYLQAIGGKSQLQSIEDVNTTMSASIQGQPIEMQVMQKAPDKYASKVTAGGMIVQEQIYDGEQGVAKGMGQSQKLEGGQLASLADQANPVPELEYLEEGYQLSVDGVEEIEGQPAYKVKVTTPDQREKTEYYAVGSKLKVRSVETTEVQGQSATITANYADYKEVDGIMWPHKVTIVGAMPFPLELNVQEVKVNAGVDDTVFQID